MHWFRTMAIESRQHNGDSKRSVSDHSERSVRAAGSHIKDARDFLITALYGQMDGDSQQTGPHSSALTAQPVTLCALFSGHSRLTPKVHVLLEFLAEYIGTARDPRLRGVDAKGLFAHPGV